MRLWVAGLAALVLSVGVQQGHAQGITPMCAPACGTVEVVATPTSVVIGANLTGQIASYTITNNKSTPVILTGPTCIRTGTISSCGSIAIVQSELESGEATSATVTYATGATAGAATLQLKVLFSGGNASGYLNATVAIPGAPQIATSPRNQPDQLERGLCLTAGAGEAAWQCGDLIVAHGMPAFRTLSKDRSLTLVYNSATAAARPAVAITVTQPAGVLPPSSVYAELRFGAVVKASATFDKWGNGATPETRQLVLSYDASDPTTSPTGIYQYTLEVKNQYASTQSPTTLTGTLIVVNRATSPYGRGWAVAGVERIYPNGTNPMLWVAGDGSARIYAPAGTNKWAAPPAAYQDTILKVDANMYTRTLRHGIVVTYDGIGRHVKTTNRAAQVTTFTYVGSTDSLLTVQVPGDTNRYVVGYTGSGATRKVDKLTDPAGRILDLTVNTTTGQLTNLVDPDLVGVSFLYDATTKAMTSRTNRQGFATNFKYGAGLKVDTVRVPYGSTGGSTAVTVFKPWDELGLAVGTGGAGKVAVDTAAVFTKIEGPLTTADDATFFVDRWGAPVKTINALGVVTTMARADALRPALVTRVRYQTGRVVAMTYDARGNLLTVDDSTNGLTYGGLSIGTPNKRTTYTYGSPNTKDSPSKIKVLGRADSTRYTYNDLGLTDTVIDPRNHRTRYIYDRSPAKNGLLIAVYEDAVTTWKPGTPDTAVVSLRDSLVYDAKGNPTRSISPAGIATTYVNNTYGLPGDIYDALGVRTRVEYDAMGRDTLTSEYLTAVPLTSVPLGNPLALCDSQIISCTATPAINNAGGLGFGSERFTRKRMVPSSDTLIDPRGVIRKNQLDARGAVASMIDEFGAANTFTYDAAGQLVTKLLRSGQTITFTYDLLGRRTGISFPARVQTDDYPNLTQTAKGDTITSVYDALGLTETHTNREGVLKRWFNADGSLRKQTWQPNAFDTSWNVTGPGAWTDLLEYAYDAAGARTVMRHNSDSVVYSYKGSGDLDSMRVRFGKDGTASTANRIFKFSWDQVGRRRAIVYPVAPSGQPMVVTWKYDATGGVREQVSNHVRAGSTNTLKFTLTTDQVDPLGRTLHQYMACTYNQLTLGSPCGGVAGYRDTPNRYSVQGWLVKQANDSMRYDMSGNMVYRSSSASDSTLFDMTDPGQPYTTNRLRKATIRDVNGLTVMNYLHDADGSRYQEYDNSGSSTSRYRAWYDAMGRTTGSVDIWHNSSSNYGANACGYDPVGNLARPCQTLQGRLTFDGANVVGMGDPGGAASQNPRWSFVHGPGTDDPLIGLYNTGSISSPSFKIYYYVTDGAGRHLAVGDSSGYLSADDYGNWGDHGGVYAGGAQNGFSFGASRFDGGPSYSGRSFFRNRVYDQATGRWNQEDPIGVAGGINLYQFNGNNPATYTDPFGLCIPMPTCALALAGSWGARGEVVGAVIGTLIEPGAGTIALAAAGAQIGSALGLAVALSDVPSSAGEMQKEVRKNQAPKSIERVDPGNPDQIGDPLPHIHFKNRRPALRSDGTWKHGAGELSKAEAEWVQKHNWTLPSE